MLDTPADAVSLFAEGKSCRINGAYDEAIALFQRVLAVCPDHAGAHCELGLAYCFSGLFDESIAELVRAAELAPGDVEIQMQLAKMYTMLGMYDEGAAAFRAVMELCQPSDADYIEAEKQLSYLM